MTVATDVDVAAAVQLACLLEASAPKPGNVSPANAFQDVSYTDFLASAAAIGPAFAHVGRVPLGDTIRHALDATARWTSANTNLGIVLLLAPLAAAAREPSGDALRARVTRVLAGTTIEDAASAYAAIRRIAPGGLGRADAQDIASEPTVTLVEAMRLAADRDGVAHEYATSFATTFEVGAPAVSRARADGLPWEDAVVEGYLTLLASTPDTLIRRKLGAEAATEVSERARRTIAAGGVRTPAGRSAIAKLDVALRDPRNARNPGTTADLTAAAVFVTLLAGLEH